MKIVILRLLEIVLTSVVLFVFSPTMLVITGLIIIDSGLPVFYLSPRVGKDGKEFKLFYFRTMYAGTGSSEERLTRIGHFLRNYSLDHVPQLFNLLRGDMHIVGPRPMMLDEADMSDGNYQQVLKVKPGMVGPAILQLGRYYNPTDFSTKVKLEKSYLTERSAGSDIRLVRAAIHATLKSRGNIKKRGESSTDLSETEN